MTPGLPRLISSSGDAKPTVLLVDDHEGILKAVSGMLASDYGVAGVATRGSQALDIVRHLQPDVIVLDINMPGLNGFQTLRALEQAGSRAPVVFLSMVEGEEFVREAFRSGGTGYVLKSRVASDLPSAIDHALLGRRFVPSLTSLAGLTGVGRHAIHLHTEDASSLDEIATLFDRALRQGDATCVVAGEDIRRGLARRLHARGWDVQSSMRGRYRAIDAAEALDGFMRDGLPDARLLAEVTAELDQYRRAAGEASRLLLFGSMAALLLADGNAPAMVVLERLWESLTRDLPFLTVCAYSVSSCSERGLDLWSDVCAEHSAVSHASDL